MSSDFPRSLSDICPPILGRRPSSRPRNHRFPWQPHGGGRLDHHGRYLCARLCSLWRFHWDSRGCGAPRRRQRLQGQGGKEGRRKRQRSHRHSTKGTRRPSAGIFKRCSIYTSLLMCSPYCDVAFHRRYADQTRWHPQQGEARGQRHPGRFSRRG